MTGNIRWFAQALHDLGNGVHNLSTADLRLVLLTGAVTPAIGTAGPHVGGTGTTNLITNQVALGTAYTGPIVLTGESWTLVAGVPTLRAAIVTIAQDAGGFTNARWAAIFNQTDANRRALCFIDLGSDRSIVGGSLTLDWSGADNDILTITQPV